jgi:hypothetical protein
MSQTPAQESTQTQECGGYSYAIEIVKQGNPIFRAEFSIITDVGSLTLMSIINIVKLLYPDAEIKVHVCKDMPVFATPFFELVIKPFVSQRGTASKFG